MITFIQKKEFSIVLFMILLVSATGFAQGNQGYKITIDPMHGVLSPEDALQFSAVLTDKYGTVYDTTFTWSVDATGFGTIDDSGLFIAITPGKCFVYASVGELSQRAHVTIRDTANCDTTQQNWSYLEILPEDTLVLVGESVQYTAYLIDSVGNRNDTTPSWELCGMEVGTLSTEGLFTADLQGTGLIRATLGKYRSTTKVFVSTSEDTASCDSLQIRFRDRDGVQHGQIQRYTEKDVFIISGLSFPFNLLNGGEIIFPAGSLSENIDIDISLPDCASIVDSTISFSDQILNGISFHVYVDGELVSPYYFDAPVDLILPFKEDLLNTLGVNPDDLWMFFYTDSSDFDDQGISNIIVDTEMNKIYAQIAHFSDLVIGNKNLITTSIDDKQNVSISTFTLFKNFPNPFNPATTIRFSLKGAVPQKVRITIYNAIGQEVRSLVNETIEPGLHSIQWDGKNNQGRAMGSGIYVYQLETQNRITSQRMVLLK